MKNSAEQFIVHAIGYESQWQLCPVLRFVCLLCMCVFFLFVIDLQEANDSLKGLAEEQNPAHDSMTGTSESSACMLSIL